MDMPEIGTDGFVLDVLEMLQGFLEFCDSIDFKKLALNPIDVELFARNEVLKVHLVSEKNPLDFQSQEANYNLRFQNVTPVNCLTMENERLQNDFANMFSHHSQTLALCNTLKEENAFLKAEKAQQNKSYNSNLKKTQRKLIHQTWANNRLRKENENLTQQNLELRAIISSENSQREPLDFSKSTGFNRNLDSGTNYNSSSFPVASFQSGGAARLSDRGPVQSMPFKWSENVGASYQSVPPETPSPPSNMDIAPVMNSMVSRHAPCLMQNNDHPEGDSSSTDESDESLLYNQFRSGTLSVQAVSGNTPQQLVSLLEIKRERIELIQSVIPQSGNDGVQAIGNVQWSQASYASAVSNQAIISNNLGSVAATSCRREVGELNQNAQEGHCFMHHLSGIYSCKCEAEFNTMVGLRRHIKRATHKYFPCGVCGIRFHFLNEMKAHRNKRHKHITFPDVAEWGCTHCGRIFLSHMDCNMHYIEHHSPWYL
ncbi:unnamed protein product [Orchesella dallaii]|uniref:C2H2-type domain-containing protein n=1 Tax=Orchesella dallaii TaxID=48710 RepID=A0ABP1QNN0_9HEXA